VARVLERDDFSLRLRENKPLTMLEIIYPLIQGYDSVCLEADVEFGGTDQKFNLIVGRHLQEVYGQKPQCIVTMPLLVGLDGKNKMSKSLGNYVGVLDNPKDMFGKIMSISDEVMWEYFRLLTDHKSEDAKKMHPKEAKMMLAQTIVSFYHSPEAGLREKDEFARVFSQKELPQDMLVYKVKENGPDLLEVLVQAKIVNSKNEARRLLTQGAISMIDAATNQETAVSAQTINIPAPGIVLKIGKKKFLKIICQN
jgi:tyrosyl-tRNA synthetase